MCTFITYLSLFLNSVLKLLHARKLCLTGGRVAGSQLRRQKKIVNTFQFCVPFTERNTPPPPCPILKCNSLYRLCRVPVIIQQLFSQNLNSTAVAVTPWWSFQQQPVNTQQQAPCDSSLKKEGLAPQLTRLWPKRKNFVRHFWLWEMRGLFAFEFLQSSFLVYLCFRHIKQN